MGFPDVPFEAIVPPEDGPAVDSSQPDGGIIHKLDSSIPDAPPIPDSGSD
jgi:hypothetical protein